MRDRFAGLPIPVRGVRFVAFATVEIGMHPRSIRGADVLRDLVRAIPVAAPLVPEGLEQRRDAGRRRRRLQGLFEFGEIHGRSIA